MTLKRPIPERLPSGLLKLPAMSFAIEDVTDAGEFSALVAVYDVPSRQDFFRVVHVIEQGAFKQVARQLSRRNADPLPTVWTHLYGIPPIGDYSEIEDRDSGLFMRGQLYIEDTGIAGEYARSCHFAMQRRSLTAFSFTVVWDESKERDEYDEGTGVLTLYHGRAAELWEAGPTLVGRHQDARLLDVASAEQQGPPLRRPVEVAPGVTADETFGRLLALEGLGA